MNILDNQFSPPVKREAADRYLLLTLLSFAASVGITRLFLEITGYPQLGNSELHIAHVLWGGLLLFVAALLPLMIANRWIFTLTALLAGIGVGLFIDEVGKFITQSNDYFYPAAAPIIYALFLLTVIVYLRARKPPKRSARAELYRALDALEELLEHDLDIEEREDLEERLKFISRKAEHPDLAYLADQLLDVVSSKDLHIVPDTPTFYERVESLMLRFENRFLTRRRHRAVLIGGLAALGALAFVELIGLLLSLLEPGQLEQALRSLIAEGRVSSQTALSFYLLRLILESTVGITLFMAAVYFILGRERLAVRLSVIGLLLSLAVVNLLLFYFDQFVTLLTATIQFLLLLGVLRYRHRYLTRRVPRNQTWQKMDGKAR